MAAKITSIPAEKIIQLAREIVQQNLLIFVRVGGHNDIPTAANIPRYCHAFRSHRQRRHKRGNSGVREGSWDLGVEWFPMPRILLKRRFPSLHGQMPSTMYGNDRDP